MNELQVIHNGATLAGELWQNEAGEVPDRNAPGAVCLHAGVADRRMWHAHLPQLAAGRRVLLYDRRGFGATISDDVPFSHVDDLAAVMDHCGMTDATLIGCSQGGRIAIDFALAHPERCRALVLIAPAIGGAPDLPPETPAIEAKFEALEAAEVAEDVERVNEIEVGLWLDGAEAEGPRVTGPARELLAQMNRIALTHPPLAREIEPADAWEALHRIAVPVLAVWGELDFRDFANNCRHLLAQIPGARGEALDGVAHLPSLEQPERLDALIGAFLEEHGN